jgi:hypothetical protein
MAVDVQKAGAIGGLIYQMIVPDFVVKRTSGHGSSLRVGIFGIGDAGRGAPKRSAARKNGAGGPIEPPRQAVMVADVEKPIHSPINTRFLADWQRQGGAQVETLAQRAMC